MERLYYSGKWYLTHLQLYYCCWFAPVRFGLFIIGYFNIAVDLLYMMGIANDGLEPTILSVQNELTKNVSKPIPVAAYATELGFNVVLLCGLHNRDLVLMQVYLYYTMFAVVLAFMTYSMVFAAVTLRYKIAIITSILLQVYCILLVRSEILKMKMMRKKYEYSRLAMGPLSPPNYPKNGQINAIAMTEIPKQDVQIVIGDENIKYTNLVEVKKDPKMVDSTTVEVKKEAELNVKIDSKEKDDEENLRAKSKEVKMAIKEKKKEEKRIKEEKKKEEKRIKEDKKKMEKKNKEDKKNKKHEILKDLKKEKQDKSENVTENPNE